MLFNNQIITALAYPVKIYGFAKFMGTACTLAIQHIAPAHLLIAALACMAALVGGQTLVFSTAWNVSKKLSNANKPVHAVLWVVCALIGAAFIWAAMQTVPHVQHHHVLLTHYLYS